MGKKKEPHNETNFHSSWFTSICPVNENHLE